MAGQRKLKIGWIGCGFVGQVAHLANYTDITEAEIVALAETRPKLGQLVCERYGIPRYYPDHKALLKDPDVDAVVAVVRREHTAAVAHDVLSSGLHLFTEKPMAPTLEEAAGLVAAAEAGNLRYAVGFMRRHDEGVQAAKRLLDRLLESGELGEVIYARFYCFGSNDWCGISGFVGTDESRPESPELPLAPSWLAQELHSNYAHFMNVCIHDLNLMRYLFGYRPTVRHVAYNRNRGSCLLLDFGSFPAAFEFGDVALNRWDEGVEIYFERGRLRVVLPPAMLRNQPAGVELYREDGTGAETVRPESGWSWAFRRQAEAFVYDVLEDREPLANGADSLEDMTLVEEIWRHIQAASGS